MEKIILNLAKKEGISDIHIATDKPIACRINGRIETENDTKVKNEDILKFLKGYINKDLEKQFDVEKSIDFSFSINDNVRLRANAFYSQDGINIALRILSENILKFHDVGFPPVVEQILQSENGLILVTGPTGSGKSTSLAAVIDYFNESHQRNIITIEDPIEYLHNAKSSIITQREIGAHAVSFSSALRAALREDPDIILVGELRDLETIQLALTAAETGHLVLATLHTSGAPNTINRIIDVFPGEQQGQVRAQLATSLKVAITQRLLPKIDGNGRVPAFEVMVCNTAVQNLIREEKIFQIPTIMQTGAGEGMVLMDKSIEQLKSAGSISYDIT